MSYSFDKDDKGKSFEMKLDDATILTAFVTEDSDSELPEVADGYYGGIGEGVMSGDWTPAGGGGGSSDFTTATVSFDTTNVTGSYNILIAGAFAVNDNGSYYSFSRGGFNQADPEEYKTYEVILYKGVGKLTFQGGQNIIFKDADNNIITDADITENTTIYVFNA